MKRILETDIEFHDKFTELPKELIIKIVLSVNINDVFKLSQSTTKLNNLTWNNNDFWFYKFIRDFALFYSNIPGWKDHFLKNTERCILGIKRGANVLSWRDAYRNFGKMTFLGSNIYGQLGTTNDYYGNVRPPNIRVKYVSCGEFHTVLIDLNDKVWVFGANGYGQLGLGHKQSISKPNPLLLKDKQFMAKLVTCGGNSTMLIDLDDNLWGFGRNDYGQLGVGDNSHKLTPIMISKKIRSVACSEFHTIILNLDNEAWVFGRNDYGQLGLGHNENRNIPNPLIISTPNKQIHIKAKSIACGSLHTMLTTWDNYLVGFGNNSQGQLCVGDNINRNVPFSRGIKVKKVACGSVHTIVISLEDNIGVCGNNQYRQLGLTDHINRNYIEYIPNFKAINVFCGINHTIVINKNNKVLLWGPDESKQVNTMNNLINFNNSKYKFASGGRCHNAMIKTISQVDSNYHLLSFNDALKKLNTGKFLGFSVENSKQYIPHNPDNVIATFKNRGTNDVYYVELRYDILTNDISPPV